MIKEFFFLFRLVLMSTQSWLYRILAYAGAIAAWCIDLTRKL